MILVELCSVEGFAVCVNPEYVVSVVEDGEGACLVLTSAGVTYKINGHYGSVVAWLDQGPEE